MDKRSALALASGAVLALGLATGCGGPEEKSGAAGAPDRAEPTVSAPAKGPVYGGKEIPGLLGQPVWARGTGGDTRANCPGAAESTDAHGATVRCVVGDAVVLTEEVPDRGASDGAGTKDDYDGMGGYLVVTDRRTGKTAWSTREMTAPPAVAAANRPGTYPTAQLRPLSGTRGILLWNPAGSDQAVITVVDLATGRRLAEGPPVMLDITRDEDRTAVSPDGRTAVSQFGEGVVAWDTETGRELWRRTDDKSLRPMAQSPGGVLYAETDGKQALNARTGAALAPYDDIPEFTSNGYGILRDEKGLFVFRAAPAPAEGKS